MAKATGYCSKSLPCKHFKKLLDKDQTCGILLVSVEVTDRVTGRRKTMETKTLPVTAKQYQCERCGCISTQKTNHYGPTWSHGHFNTCEACPPWAKYPEFGGSTVWDCLEVERGTSLVTKTRRSQNSSVVELPRNGWCSDSGIRHPKTG